MSKRGQTLESLNSSGARFWQHNRQLNPSSAMGDKPLGTRQFGGYGTRGPIVEPVAPITTRNKASKMALLNSFALNSPKGQKQPAFFKGAADKVSNPMSQTTRRKKHRTKMSAAELSAHIPLVSRKQILFDGGTLQSSNQELSCAASDDFSRNQLLPFLPATASSGASNDRYDLEEDGDLVVVTALPGPPPAQPMYISPSDRRRTLRPTVASHDKSSYLNDNSKTSVLYTSTRDPANNDHLRDLIQKYHQGGSQKHRIVSGKDGTLPHVPSSLVQVQPDFNDHLGSNLKQRYSTLNRSRLSPNEGSPGFPSPASALNDKSKLDTHRLNRTMAKKQENKQLSLKQALKVGSGLSKVDLMLEKSPYVDEIRRFESSESPSVTSGSQQQTFYSSDRRSGRQPGFQSRVTSPESGGAAGRRKVKIKLEREALKKAQYEREVQDIVQSCQKRFEVETARARREAVKKQAAQETVEKEEDKNGQYQMPTRQTMRQNLKEMELIKRQRLLQELSKNSRTVEGMISVNDLSERQRLVHLGTKSKVQEYVNHFSHLAEILPVGNSFVGEPSAAFNFISLMGKNIDQKTQAQVKSLSQKVDQMMKDAKQKRDLMASSIQQTIVLNIFQKADLKPSIYQYQQEEDKRTLKNVAQTFTNNVEYQERLKQRNIEDTYSKGAENGITDQDEAEQAREGEEAKTDPRIKYMKRCLESLDINLPILDKIYRKTLCLQDYHLSEGNCRALAEACEYLDTQIVNRMLFNNCGLQGDQLAVILEGIAKMRDFKGLIYCKSSLNAHAIDKLTPLFLKPVPHNFEELSLVDTRMAATLIEQLFDSLTQTQCRLRKLTLVNVNHSESSFDKLVAYVLQGGQLRELDLSWQSVRPHQMLKLLHVVKDNRHLTNLSLSYNMLLEEQPTQLTEAQVNEGYTQVELSVFNQEVMDCFTDFVKYNIYLVHLNLERTGLIEPALRHIVALLRKSQALRCLHLCGNEGLSTQFIEWTRTRIHAKKASTAQGLRPISAATRNQGSSKASKGSYINAKGLMKIQRGLSLKDQSLAQKNQEWKDIRQGLKLRNIVQSMRMEDKSLALAGQDECSKLIISRHLGHKILIPGVAQWTLNTGMKDECWICGRHILTVFVWTPRIGQLAQERDPLLKKYYQGEVDRLRKEWDFQPAHFDGAPYFFSPATNQKPIRMKDAIEFCLEHDPQKPDFLQEAISQQLVRPYCTMAPAQGSDTAEQLSHSEIQAITDIKHKYYREHWHRALLSSLRYKNPSIANADSYTQLNLQMSEEAGPIYFHVDFMKPGKNTYFVEHKRAPGGKDGFFDQIAFDYGDEEDGKAQSQLYVHNMLSQFRQEDVVAYHNPRHVRIYRHDIKQVKPVFREWKEDGPETYLAMFKHDWDHMLIKDIIPDPQQIRRIKTEIQSNLSMLRDIYIYLQSKSPNTYPFVEVKAIRDHFINVIGLGHGNMTSKATLENIMLETAVQGALARGEQESRVYKLQRYTFIEVLVRFSTYLNTNLPLSSCDKSDHHKHREPAVNQETGTDKNYAELNYSQGFFLFLEETIKPYWVKAQIEWQSFRDEQLWTHDVKMTYTLNDLPLRAVYQKYCQRGQTSLSVDDFERMLVRDLKLPITSAMVKQAYAMSQMTVVAEREKSAFEAYRKTSYAEFLEVLGRVALALFKETESEQEELHWKIEQVLESLLQQVNETVSRNEIIIEHFSDSDDDY